MLRVAGGLQSSADYVQAQQQLQRQQQPDPATQQQQWVSESEATLQPSAADLPARPHSTNTELSFVEQLQQQSTAQDSMDLQATASSSLILHQQQQSTAHEESDQLAVVGSVGQQMAQIAEPSPIGHTAVEVVTADASVYLEGALPAPNEAHGQQQRYQAQKQEDSTADSFEPEKTAAPEAAAVATAAASTTPTVQHGSPAAAVVMPAVDHSAGSLEQQSPLQEGAEQININSGQQAPTDTTAADVVGEDAAGQAHELDEASEMADDVVAEMSALSSAVAMEVAAAVEGAQLSSSSSTWRTGSVVDRYEQE